MDLVKATPVNFITAPAHAADANEETPLEREVGHLFEALWLPLCRYLAGMVGDGDAEDIAQEAFLRYFKARLQGVQVDHAKAWLFQVGHNLSVDRLRQESWTDLDAPGSQPASVEQDLMVQDQIERLRFGLRLLSARERSCLELRCEGFRYREIAEILGIKLPTVVTCITRAVTKLRKVLA